jgi:hypothetical protein
MNTGRIKTAVTQPHKNNMVGKRSTPSIEQIIKISNQSNEINLQLYLTKTPAL